MNRYVLIASMKPVFDCFDVTTRAKLRQTCKWCNKHIRRRLDKTGAQLIIRRAWYYYKLHKNLCISSPFTPVENLKLLLAKSNSCLNINEFNTLHQGVERAIIVSCYTKYKLLVDPCFTNLIKCGTELLLPHYKEEIGRRLDIVKSYYIKLFGNNKNLIIDLVINNSKWLSVNIPKNASAIRIHFGLLPMVGIPYSLVNVCINHPINLQRRYLHGIILKNDIRKIIPRETLFIDNKIYIEIFYPDGSKELIGNIITNYLVYRGTLFRDF